MATGAREDAALTRWLVDASAAYELGWTGVLIADVALLGDRVSAVVDVDEDARRRREPAAPVLDIDVLTVWEWPEAAASSPPTVLRLSGVLVRDRSWRRAHAAACRWSGFAAAAIVVDDPPGADEQCALECAVAGIGIVAPAAGGALAVALPGRPGKAATARRRPLDRWVEEALYGELLARKLLS